MKPAASPGAAPPAAAGGVGTGGWKRRLVELARVLRQGYMQVLGIPDYQAYLAHMAAHHGNETPLSRRDFCKQAIDRKYGRSGPRCC